MPHGLILDSSWQDMLMADQFLVTCMESGRTGLPAVLTNVANGASINISMRDFWGDLAEVLSRSFYIDLSVIICTLCSWEAVKEVWLSIFPIVSQAHDRLRSHRDTTIDCATWTSTGNHPQMAKPTGEFSSFRYIIYCWLLISQYIPWNSFVVQCIPHKSARFRKSITGTLVWVPARTLVDLPWNPAISGFRRGNWSGFDVKFPGFELPFFFHDDHDVIPHHEKKDFTDSTTGYLCLLCFKSLLVLILIHSPSPVQFPELKTKHEAWNRGIATCTERVSAIVGVEPMLRWTRHFILFGDWVISPVIAG